MAWQKWEEGRVTLYCDEGHVLYIDGKVRLHLNEDGDADEYECHGATMPMVPCFDQVVAIKVT